MMGAEERTLRRRVRSPTPRSISLSLCACSVTCCTPPAVTTVILAARLLGLLTTTIDWSGGVATAGKRHDAAGAGTGIDVGARGVRGAEDPGPNGWSTSSTAAPARTSTR